MNNHDRGLGFGSISRRSLSRMLVGGSAGVFAATASAAAQEPVTAMSVAGGTVEDQLAIQQLLYRYGMAIDNLDAAALSDCFAPNAVLWGGGFDPQGKFHEFTMQGDFAPRLVKSHRAYEFTMHVMLNHAYTVQERTATGMTYGIFTWLVKKAGELKKIDGYARYHDELVKQGDRWRILKRRFENVFNTEMPVQVFAEDTRNGRR